MQQQKIYMQAWLDAHGRAKVVNTDKWYLDFANQLLPLVAESYIYGGKEMEEDQKQVALTCALYLEDCVADGGNWRQFIHWHQENYGRPADIRPSTCRKAGNVRSFPDASG